MSRFDLEGRDKVALITGGASGIGREVAEVFAEAGYRVALADIDRVAGEAAIAALRGKGADAELVPCDVGDEGQVAAAIAACTERWGRLDFLLNNAGITGRGTPIENLEPADLESVLAVDLKAVFYACKHAVPVMRAQGGGSILNVASITAETGSPYYAAYGAAKAGVIALTRGLARNIGRFNVRINCLSPGSVTGTGLMRDNPLRPQDVAALIKTIPLGRPGRPRDIAHFALFLASPLAGHIHGAVLTIDGGESLGYL